MSYRVVNIVSTFNLNIPINLSVLNQHDFSTVYKPNRFTGLMKKYKTGTALIFSNGKCVISGSKSEESARKLSLIIQRLVSSPKVSDFKLQNIVATVDLRDKAVKSEGTIFDLRKIKEKIASIYEPERYSALVTEWNGVKIIIFHNGKINFTAAKTIEQLDSSFAYILNILFELNLIK